MLENLMSFDLAGIVKAVLMILGAASIIAKMTPTNKDDKALAFIYKLVHMLGLTKSDKKKVK